MYHSPLQFILPDILVREETKGVQEIFGATPPVACQMLRDPSSCFAGAEPGSLLQFPTTFPKVSHKFTSSNKQ